MTLTYDTAMQNDIALLLARCQYSDLTAEQRIAVDGNDAASPPVKGATGRAADTIMQYANAYTSSAVDWDSIPDTWRGWFIHEAAQLALAGFPDADRTAIQSAASHARREAIVSYATSDFNSSTAGLVGSLSMVALRNYVSVASIRASDSVILEPSLIDTAIEDVVQEIWTDADWTFKQVQATLTIGTDGSVTVGSGLSLDQLLDDRILYSGTTGGFAALVDWQTILDHAAGSPVAGKPLLFHLTHGPDELVWTFERTPDQEYTAKGTFTLRTPTQTDRATIDSALALFPVDFRSVIKKRVLGVALRSVGRVTVPNQLYAETTDKLAGLMTRWDKTAREAENSRYDQHRPMGLGPMGGTIGGRGL